MLRVRLLIQAAERVTAPVRRIRSAIRGMARDGERDVGRVGRAMDRMRASARRAGAGIASAFRFSGLSGLLSRMAALALRGGRRIGRNLANGLKRALQYGLAGITAGVTYLLYRLTAGTITTAAQFEQFQVVLEGTEGSARAAQRAMAWVRNFATTTPYEVADVMEAFVALRSYGIDPTNGTLRSLGNAASGMNKQLMQAVEMLSDAQNGEFDRLREFGITAQVTGNRVRLSYQQNGRQITRQVNKNATEIQAAITGIFDSRFQGMMDRQSRTLAGLWSNILDQISNFQLQIANAGFFDFVKGKVQQLLNRINELAANGTLRQWASDISRWLVRAGTDISTFLTETDWREVRRQVSEVARAFWDLARAIARVADLARRVAGVTSQLTQFTPIAQLQRVLSGRGVGVDVRIPIPSWIDRIAPAARPPRALPPAIQGLIDRQHRRPQIPLGPPMRPLGASQRPRETRHRADVNLNIRADPGLRPTVTRSASSSGDLRVNVLRGFVGAAPA